MCVSLLEEKGYTTIVSIDDPGTRRDFVRPTRRLDMFLPLTKDEPISIVLIWTLTDTLIVLNKP